MVARLDAAHHAAHGPPREPRHSALPAVEVAALSGAAYPKRSSSRRGRCDGLGRTLARCKFYDYENHRWLNFTGRPTTEPDPVMRELQERGSAGTKHRAKAATRGAAALTNAGSPAG